MPAKKKSAVKTPRKPRNLVKMFAEQLESSGIDSASANCQVPHKHVNECDCNGQTRVRNRSNAKD